jgi:hypothetical protein
MAHNGNLHRRRGSKFVADCNGVVVGLVYGAPPGQTAEFLKKLRLIHTKILELKQRVKKAHGNRGKFKALNCGISYGGGQPVRRALSAPLAMT